MYLREDNGGADDEDRAPDDGAGHRMPGLLDIADDVLYLDGRVDADQVFDLLINASFHRLLSPENSGQRNDHDQQRSYGKDHRIRQRCSQFKAVVVYKIDRPLFHGFPANGKVKMSHGFQ